MEMLSSIQPVACRSVATHHCGHATLSKRMKGESDWP